MLRMKCRELNCFEALALRIHDILGPKITVLIHGLRLDNKAKLIKQVANDKIHSTPIL